MIFSGENSDSISGDDFFRGFIDGSERRFFRKAVVLIRTLDAYKIFCSAEKRKNKGKRKTSETGGLAEAYGRLSQTS